MKILVIGGAGYIGSHICKLLFDNGFEVIIYDSLELHHHDSKIWGHLIKGNILDEAKLDKVFSKCSPKIVIDLASYIDISESILDPQKYIHNNLQGSINVLNAVKKYKVKHFIFASSCSVYGSNLQKKSKEIDPLSPLSPYAFIKSSLEEIIAFYAKAYDFNFLNMRYFNVAGLDPDCKFIRSQLAHFGIISKLAKLHDKIFSVNGNQCLTPDKTAVCDYVHVKDVASATLFACKYLVSGGKSETINVGSGHGFSVLEVIERVEKHLKKKINYIFGHKKAGCSDYSVADLSKVEKIIGFKPIHSDLDEIIQSEII